MARFLFLVTSGRRILQLMIVASGKGGVSLSPCLCVVKATWEGGAVMPGEVPVLLNPVVVQRVVLGFHAIELRRPSSGLPDAF